MQYVENGPHVLVVDDEPAIRDLCAMLLASWGYAVTEACDGLDAREKLETLVVHAVLLDLNMPRMRGDALLQEIRVRTPGLPVVIMSTEGAEQRNRALALGATSFLAKPFRPGQLQEQLALALGQRPQT